MKKLLGVAFVCLVALAGCGGGGDEPSKSSDATEASAVSAMAIKCVDKFNRAEGNKGMIAQATDLRVSAGAVETFPDLCLITMASPSLKLVAQYTEDPTIQYSGGWQTNLGTIDELPPSTTDWIGTYDHDTQQIVLYGE